MDNAILKWILANPVSTAVILVILIAVIVLIWKNRKDVLLKSAQYIVAKVEEEWGSDTGRIKFAQAYEYIKTKYPIITFFMSSEKLSQIIEDALAQLKEILKTKEAKEKKRLEDEAAAVNTEIANTEG